MIDIVPPPRIERWDRLGRELGVDLYIARDDLLPFPLPGNKVRKLVAELHGVPAGTTVVSNGAIDSNHCRTVAWLAAERGLHAHLVLHDESGQGAKAPGLAVLTALGAAYSVVAPTQIAAEIARVETATLADGLPAHIVPGGCHSRRGAIAYRDAAEAVFESDSVDLVFVASGTGATHGGIAAAAHRRAVDVIGISVARPVTRGIGPVVEAAEWAGVPDAHISFDDKFTAGGYGKSSSALREIVATSWRHGLPLDETYTGKAMWALKTYADEGRLQGKRVLFWHTGGLWNRLSTWI